MFYRRFYILKAQMSFGNANKSAFFDCTFIDNSNMKGVMDMSENKNAKKKCKSKEKKPLTAPGNIKGKIEVSDTRERKDGPGGN